MITGKEAPVSGISVGIFTFKLKNFMKKVIN